MQARSETGPARAAGEGVQPARRVPGLLREATALALILLAVALVYGRSAGYGYAQFDDAEYIQFTAPVLRGLDAQGVVWAFTTTHMSNWHPLTWLSFMLDISLFGMDPGAQHAVNLVLHFLNSALVFALARRLACGRDIALFAGLLFAVHPLHVESVVWIAERKDVLCALFYLSALLLHLRYARAPSLRRWWPVFAAGVLALLSKPMAVTLPVALLLLDAWPLNRTGAVSPGACTTAHWKRAAIGLILLEKLPLVLASAGVCVMTVLAQHGALSSVVDVPLAHRASNVAFAYATYLRQLLLPSGLAALYPLRPIDTLRQLLPACAVLLAVATIAFAVRHRKPWVLFGLSWFLFTLLPVIGIVQVGMQSHADRYMYLPSVGPLLALAAHLQAARPGWLRWRPVAALLVAFYSAMAWMQVGYWNGPLIFYSRILDVSPDAWQAHLGLANTHLRAGNLPLAEQHAARAQELAPGAPAVIGIVGNVWMARGDPARAERAFRAVLEQEPGSALAMFNLGTALAAQGRIEEADAYRAAARRAQPERFGVESR